MRTTPPPGSKRVSDWVGKRVRFVKAIANGYGELPAGTLATVKDAGGGLRLSTDACPHCGLQLYVSRVRPDRVEVL